MLTEEETAYLGRIAWAAVVGIVGADAAQPGGELYDSIYQGLVGTADACYRRGVDASMVQLSLLPDAGHAVG